MTSGFAYAEMRIKERHHKPKRHGINSRNLRIKDKSRCSRWNGHNLLSLLKGSVLNLIYVSKDILCVLVLMTQQT